MDNDSAAGERGRGSGRGQGRAAPAAASARPETARKKLNAPRGPEPAYAYEHGYGTDEIHFIDGSTESGSVEWY
ncbi:hypothetical protein EVAR_86945_1 [Eumeta japonica]|uniref:Uncharacterized protein n=1 Tax=Eumeta variegata TaxID=151549 RepID=A0A4C1W840_EUMVA|nr:hypothetical protein EVAR_86945_1 [Eumeta japonica]